MHQMKQKKKDTSSYPLSTSHWSQHVSKRILPIKVSSNPCNCVAPDRLFSAPDSKRGSEEQEFEQCVPMSPVLADELRVVLREREHCGSGRPLSILLLHMSQVEAPPLAPESVMLYHRRSYHASAGLLSQVLANVHKVIRSADQMFIAGEGGIAFIFPDVDRQGIQRILERVHRSISLLQAETMIPPLTRETIIVLGGGTYPDSSASISELGVQIGHVAYHLTLRPVLTAQLHGVMPILAPRVEKVVPEKRSHMPGIPFMELPKTLPRHLKRLIPHRTAQELRCVPVGREYHTLTVAMVDPTNNTTISRLQQMTGLTIFPVACAEQQLTSLLASGW